MAGTRGTFIVPLDELRKDVQFCVTISRRRDVTDAVRKVLLEVALADSTSKRSATYILIQLVTSGYDLGEEAYLEVVERFPDHNVYNALAAASHVPASAQRDLLLHPQSSIKEKLAKNPNVNPEVFLKLLTDHRTWLRGACAENTEALAKLPVPLLRTKHQRLLSEMLIGSSLRVQDPVVTGWEGTIRSLQEEVFPVKILWKKTPGRVLDHLDDYDEADVEALALTWEGTISDLQDALQLIER